MIVGLAVLALGWLVWTSWHDPQGQVMFRDFAGAALAAAAFLLPVLGILAMTSEWSQRTALTTFTLSPRRIPVLLAKLVAALLLMLGVMLAITVVAALATALAGAISGDPVTWAGDDPWQLLGRPVPDAGHVRADGCRVRCADPDHRRRADRVLRGAVPVRRSWPTPCSSTSARGSTSSAPSTGSAQFKLDGKGWESLTSILIWVVAADRGRAVPEQPPRGEVGQPCSDPAQGPGPSQGSARGASSSGRRAPQHAQHRALDRAVGCGVARL